MDETKLLVLADRFKKLRDRVDGLSVKQEEIQLKEGRQGPKGEQGDRGLDGSPGKDGDDGADGTDGKDGKDGVSVVNAEIAFDGSLVIYLSDGKEIDCGYVVKETGDTVIQTLKQGASVSGGSGVTSITSTDGSVSVTTVGGVVDLSVTTAGATTTLISQVRNQTGTTLLAGEFVYINGATGNKATVTRALATSDATSAQTYGMVSASIANNALGYVTIIGTVANLDTSAYTEGVQLYLSPTVAGGYTTTKPVAPYHMVYVGVVTRSHINFGTIEVKVQNGYELDEIHDVLITSKTNDDVLTYESASGLWKNKQLAVFTSTTKGLVPASGGSSTQYLSADGTFTTPTATATPAGADTQIQYNDAGVLGANANFTYSSTLNTLSLGPATGTATFTTRAPTTAQNPSTLVVAAQNSIRTAGTSPGGPLTLRSGNGRPTGAGAGGALSITAGNAGATGDGGAINLTAGAGGTTSGNGGAINITGGSTTSGLGGDITIQSGPSAFLYLNGGNNPNGNGGDVRGQAGQGSGAGVANGGNFLFTGGQANGSSGGNGGGLEFVGGGGASAGGTGGGLSFRNGSGGTVADTDGSIFLYLNSGSSIPGSISLDSAFGTSAIKVTRNAGTSATQVGFFNATPVAKPAPTASGTGAVLSSIVTALNNLGLVDSTALTNASATFTSTALGLVPASGGGTTTFLRADGTFATPSGSGGGATPTSGTATINFGTGNGSNEASIAVTGQTSILSTSVVTLTVKNDATSTSHTANDHSYFLELASLNSNTPTAGTGFTIKARSIHKLTGTWTINWSWL